MTIPSRTFESDSHLYNVAHWKPREGTGDLKHERAVVTVQNKKTNKALDMMVPVSDAGILGDLISGVYLERKGFERMEVTPDQLREGDVIEGLGPIVEIEWIVSLTLKMLKVMIEMRAPAEDDELQAHASIVFTQVHHAWHSSVGITRPIK